MRKLKRALIATAGAVLVAGVASQANAGPLGPINPGINGSVNFHFTGYTEENAANVLSPTKETTFGAGMITSITDNFDSSIKWYENGAGKDPLGFFLYGISDGNIRGDTTNGFQIYNIGCTSGTGCDGLIHLDIYDLPVGTDSSFAAGHLDPTDRTGFSTFNGITNVAGGNLLMSLVFDQGKVTSNLADNGTDTNPGFNELLTTLFQNANSQTLPATGDGHFFASCVAGSACPYFNNNAQGPFGSDFDAKFSLTQGTTATGGTNWQGRIDDPTFSVVVATPEPTTLSLFGMGLLGLGFFSRRRKQKQAA